MTVAAVLVNPAADRGRAGRLAEPVRAALAQRGIDAPILAGRTAAESVALARDAVAGGAEVLVAVGGDGLVHCAVQAVAGTPAALAVVPAGTGNDFADVLGVPTDPASAAAVVAGGRTRVVDAGRVEPDGWAEPAELVEAGGRWWAGVLCAGFDSAVNERANRMRWPTGPRRYDVAVFAELYRLRPRPAVLTLDGERLDAEITLVAVGNGPQYGGGFRICPDASLDDGLLDVCVVGPVSRAELVRLKPKVRVGGHVGHPAVRIFRAREVRLEAPELIAYADGERVGPLPVGLTCVPGALHVLVPGADR